MTTPEQRERLAYRWRRFWGHLDEPQLVQVAIAETGSAELLLQHAHLESAQTYAGMDTLDTKAGIVLGFAGVLLPLLGGAGGAGRFAAFICLVVAASISVVGFLPRRVKRVSATRMTLLHGRASHGVLTRQMLVDQLRVNAANHDVLAQKADRIRAATFFLLTGALILGVDALARGLDV